MKMIIKPIFAIAIQLFLCLPTGASAEPFWKDENGNPVPNTEFRSAVNGFAGWLVVTPDADWQAKWETPSKTIPRFNTANTVRRDERLFVLIFFSNPKLTDKQMAEVTCDINVTRPNGTSSIHQVDAVCSRGELKGNPSNVYLSAPIIGFIGEPKDPAGKWVVGVTLKDNIRHVSVPLTTSFTLQ
jgi:hypothetical protein